MIISKKASNVRLKDGKLSYEVSGILERVVADACEPYIRFDMGETYDVNLAVAKECIDGLDMSVTIQVSLSPSGKMEVEYLGSYYNKCDGNYIGCECIGSCTE